MKENHVGIKYCLQKVAIRKTSQDIAGQFSPHQNSKVDKKYFILATFKNSQRRKVLLDALKDDFILIRN